MIIPQNPKIYHITHIDNLSDIFTSRYLYSDAERMRLGIHHNNIGMSAIKQRRLQEHFLNPHYQKIAVGECVPFYFCPRSIMLYLLHMKNLPDIQYTGYQSDILHLEFEMDRVAAWGSQNDIPWVFTDCNAADALANFYNCSTDLSQLNWAAIHALQWSKPDIKRYKQSEFLIHKQIPIGLIHKIGVHNPTIQEKVKKIMQVYNQKIDVTVESSWYY